MVKTPIKIQLVKTLADVEPSRIVAVKNDGDTTFSLYITDKQGTPFPIKDNSGIVTITNTDGNLDINGTEINISSTLLSTINSALQSGGDISELVNDVGYLTIDNLPTKTSEFINDGSDGTTTYIENDELGLVAFSNDYNDLDNLPTIPSIDNLVPYVGATQNVDLGEHQIKAGQVEFDTTPTGNAGVGILRWNDSDGTLDLGLKGGNVTLQLGQEQVVRVVNKTGSNLLESNYQAVRVNGAQGQRLKVALAQATNDLLSAETIGLVTENIDNNQEGFVTTSGLIRGINTTGSLQGETWADGDMLYLSPFVSGRITNIKPSAPNHLITIGYVVYAHANNGSIFVKVDNGYELEELHNVTETNYTTPIDTDSLLTFDVNNSLWKRLSWANVKSNLKTYFDTIYQTALGFTPENVANKATNLTSPDNTKYPTTQAVVDGLATKFTLPALTSGSVLFSNGSTIAQDNSQLFWDDTNNRLGIGTTSPQRKLDVNGDFRAGNLVIRPSSNLSLIENQGTGSSILFIRSGGTNPLVLNDTGGGGGVIVGVSAVPGARLDVRAQGALSTDIAFRVRNSTDTQNSLVVNGAGDVYNNGARGGETNTHFGENTARARTGSFNSTFGNQAGRDLTTGASNAFFGYNAGRSVTIASANTFIGTRSGESNTTGASNVAVGQEALLLNQTALGNAAVGQGALRNNIASQNTALGNGAGGYTTTGGRNVFLGAISGRDNTTGQRNVYAGMEVALFNNGSNNTLLGEQSGLYLSDGVTKLTSLNNSVFIGQGTRALGNNETNQIVIGNTAIGDGSNSVVLGNSSITRTRLQGQVIMGSFATAPTGIEGAIYYNSTDKKHYGFNGTTWNAFY